ncbi:MAG: F0F1 ATP synthase subunit B [Bacteroidales bacterium]|jgi:F-type H+-transporting ATPase subunit b|uniref:ATP synthase subunit b n=1 Tax=bioreactor metagenome TaxID=1076179 RepID=A0A644UD24_9ZZZZ|nr:F0F1 ATP synthase subunit B [Bacteroidales bacterium]MEA4968875.1 F0F1 ATP synthase subunit B [Bacteroidaceae bacterium]NCC17945.1 ATP synthase F0 subunit B [Bacteroidia bacterium]MDD2575965.1 F0F1 ATP synthase subunit B [Bacteroidales bacterium]MDD3286683.1 F0F1 ATP synthase subunit B [Bacteroidales bacterium]
MELITPGLGLVVWMTLVFLVLLLVLGKFGWPVVSKMIDERETLIQNSLDEAQKAREEMENLKFNNDILLKKAMEERDEILKEARLLGETIKQEAHLKAQEEAQRIVASARDSINYEKLQALTELKNQVAQFSIDIASKVLEQELKENEFDKKIIEKRVSEFNFN